MYRKILMVLLMASTDWTPPAGVTIQMIRAAHAGALKVATLNS